MVNFQSNDDGLTELEGTSLKGQKNYHQKCRVIRKQKIMQTWNLNLQLRWNDVTKLILDDVL